MSSKGTAMLCIYVDLIDQTKLAGNGENKPVVPSLAPERASFCSKNVAL